MITPGSRIAEIILKRKRDNVIVAPYSLRDCRLCMTIGDPALRRVPKGTATIFVAGEDIHAWHTDEKVVEYMNREVR